MVLLKAWLSCCAMLVAMGWLLSACSALVPVVYDILLGFIVVCGASCLYLQRFELRRVIRGRLLSRRLMLPGLFAISAAFLLVKGIVTLPCHDDGLAYRIPRAMNWIMDHRWQWISSQDQRLDILGTVSEWLSLPSLIVFHTDRLIFLPNWISHLFLPGLIFSVWRTLGVGRKAAWAAMWLVPTGFCFALQAVNVSNDSLGAFFLLAAIHLAFKGGRTLHWSDLAFSILAISMATGVKILQVALIPAWLVAMGLGWRLFFSRPWPALGVCVLAALISLLPNALMNYAHGAGFTGLGYVVPTPPLVNAWCVSYYIVAQNLMPPLFMLGMHGYANLQHLQTFLTGDLLSVYYHQRVPVFFNEVAVQQAGLGFLVFLLLPVLFLLTKRDDSLPPRAPWVTRLFFVFVVVAFLHYLFFVNSDQPARLICSFYLLLAPLFFVRRRFRNFGAWRGFKVLAATAMVLGLYLALCMTENPLFALVDGLEDRTEKEAVTKAAIDRPIPEGEKTIGVIRWWHQREAWLWQPYGSRKVVEFPLRPDPARLRSLGVTYVAVSEYSLYKNGMNIQMWLKGRPWVLLAQAYTKPNDTVDDGWYLVKWVGP